MIYFDTTYLVKCYLNEAGSAPVREFAATHHGIACSEFGRFELVAAFHRKLREEQIDDGQFQALLKQLEFDDEQGLWL